MNKQEYEFKMNSCNFFFNVLANALSSEYEIVGSCNKDASRYLIPIGTIDQLTYYGKPLNSFRVSDHWNWFASLNKCADPNYVQCRSLDMPRCRSREEGETFSTRPRFGIQVCILLNDGCYHHVFGDKFDRRKRTWTWIETNPMDVVNQYLKEEK